MPEPSTGAEFWGDTMLVNGTAYPYVEIQPRRYRLRILNACNTRFMRLRLSMPWVRPSPTARSRTSTRWDRLFSRLAPREVSSRAPVILDSSNQGLTLTLAPAERADVIVDFGKTAPGDTLLLYNDAPVPFPGGTPLADFFPGNNRLANPPVPGYGPNTQTLVQFRVIPRDGPPEGKPVKLQLPSHTRPSWRRSA